MSTSITEILFTIAVSLSGLSPQGDAPEVRFHGEHIRQVGGNAEFTSDNVIYLPKPCTEAMTRSMLAGNRLSIMCRGIILHEQIHHLQKVNGLLDWDNSTCRSKFLNEVEAYQIQHKYLRANGLNSYKPMYETFIPNGCVRINAVPPSSYWGGTVKKK